MRAALFFLFLASTNLACSSSTSEQSDTRQPSEDGASDSAESDTAPSCPPLPTVTASAPVRRADIDNIIYTNCSQSICHGLAPGGGQLHLPAEGTDWYRNIVDKNAVLLPSMKLLVAGDPAQSFFVRKLSCSSTCGLETQCTPTGCGVPMYISSTADCEKVVAWVAQGAPAQ